MSHLQPDDVPEAIEPDIRFTLANERTFLAWVRTAIGLVGGGVAVFHLLADSAATTALSLVLLVAGSFAVIAGYSHFRRADRAIRSGESLPTTGVVVVVMSCSVLLAALIGAASVVLDA
ncbi:YidH family protein [Nocardioides piscis]|uniref:DUF202 domain-containing protein n=1 Tax=Nocardioides piscis TaxID=2714938 RepID=A0A6G7YC26_9ACTN|nr:DUF202 domain-containing protein [Nocardioides piscis]QIK74226.1 DUF202 domain-containing protein [Nocardioides piscis]